MRRAPSLVIACVACAGLFVGGCTKPAPAGEPVRAVRTITVASQSVSTSLEYAAEVRARTESRLGFRVGGKMMRRHVDLGDSVRAGQVLAQLDPEDLRLGQEAARATLAAAQANYEQTQADFKRFKELRDQGFISSAELERRDTALKSAQAQLVQARAQASVQGNQAAYATLTADVAGVVTGIDAEPGMVLGAGTPVLRLAHDGPRDVVFSVPEDKVAAIKALSDQGAELKVQLWGDGQVRLPARIREIAAAADPATRTYLVKADVGQAPLKLGQTATVIVDFPAATGVTKLPLSALKEEQGRTVVWVVDPASMTVKTQPVQVGGADGNLAVIAAGLGEGQKVVTAGVHVLSPGQKVKFYAEPAAPTAAAGAQPVAARVGEVALGSSGAQAK